MACRRLAFAAPSTVTTTAVDCSRCQHWSNSHLQPSSPPARGLEPLRPERRGVRQAVRAVPQAGRETRAAAGSGPREVHDAAEAARNTRRECPARPARGSACKPFVFDEKGSERSCPESCLAFAAQAAATTTAGNGSRCRHWSSSHLQPSSPAARGGWLFGSQASHMSNLPGY